MNFVSQYQTLVFCWIIYMIQILIIGVTFHCNSEMKTVIYEPPLAFCSVLRAFIRRSKIINMIMFTFIDVKSLCLISVVEKYNRSDLCLCVCVLFVISTFSLRFWWFGIYSQIAQQCSTRAFDKAIKFYKEDLLYSQDTMVVLEMTRL